MGHDSYCIVWANLTAFSLKCCFRAGAIDDKPACAACTAKCFEKPPPPPAPPVPVSKREVMLWVYLFHNESWTDATGPAFWAAYGKNFSKWMRPNVTAVSLCMYEVRPDGRFDYQVRRRSVKVILPRPCIFCTENH
jgi:hypothetical protein